MIALTFAGGVSAQNGKGLEDPTPTMRAIFEVLTELLPVSFDPDAFEDPVHREELTLQLRELARLSRALESHGGADRQFQLLARSFADDAEEAQLRFSRQRYDEASFYLQELTENCAVCHDRLPDQSDFPFSARLFERIDPSSLTYAGRSRLQIATRQFGPALTDIEALFQDPSVEPAQLDVDGLLFNYLAVAIRVTEELPRARRGLGKLVARKDAPPYLADNLQAWIASLETLEGSPVTEPSLQASRELIDLALEESRFSSPQRGLVFYLKASGVLQQGVSKAMWSGSELAEAYYLLGFAEAASRRSSWVSTADNLLEAAIRTDPSSVHARRAYGLLEERLIVGWSGSAGPYLPPSEQERLAELRELLHRSHPGAIE